MGGGADRAERGAARSRERQRTTGTALAVGLVVLGTLLVIREHRSGADVAPGKADKAAPGTTETGAGRCEHARHPVSGDQNRHRQLFVWFEIYIFT